MFPDDAGKMNINIQQAEGGLLLVPQFTLAADTNSGNRPSFAAAAEPPEGRRLFEYLVQQAHQEMDDVATGIFGADMKVSLVNDGPVTFWLQVPPIE
jgi:D-tyrosyl-tRNA(Tyr) deacylase